MLSCGNPYLKMITIYIYIYILLSCCETRRKIWEMKIDAGIFFCSAKGCGITFLASLAHKLAMRLLNPGLVSRFNYFFRHIPQKTRRYKWLQIVLLNHTSFCHPKIGQNIILLFSAFLLSLPHMFYKCQDIHFQV